MEFIPCSKNTSTGCEGLAKEKIDEFVESIIDKQVENNQYENCELTFKNISTIKNILKEKLKNIYHIRIEYPR